MHRHPISSEPLGLTRGSVRAVIAVMVVMAAICLAFAGRLDPTFAAIASSVIAFYFAGAQSRPPQPVPTGITVTTTKEPQ